MSNQTEIRKALLLLHEVVLVVTNTSGLAGRKGFKFTVGMYWGKDGKTHSGMSDLTGLLCDGRTFAIETKTPKEKISPDQTIFMQLVADNGGVAGVARCIEDAIKIIRGENDE